MNTENLLDNPQEGANYFYHFNFSKFKAILYPLAIVALFLLIKQFIINNFHIESAQSPGLLGMFNSFNLPKELPLWAKVINTIIDILSVMVILCWEAVYEKKYNKIRFVLLLSLPSIIMILIGDYSDFYKTYDKNPFYLVYSILAYFPFYALYGLFRGKILYGKKLSLIGYLIGLVTLKGIDALYEKMGSVLLNNDLFIPIYQYGSALADAFIPLSFFYFVFLTDAGFSFRNFIKMPSSVLLTDKKFAAHFIFLFTSLFSAHLYFTGNFSISWFNYMTYSFGSILYYFYLLVRLVIQIGFVYLLFSQLLLLQMGALRRRPLWMYLLSFVPVVNLFVLLFYFRNRTPLTDAEYFETEDSETQNRLYLQLFVLLFTTVCVTYRLIGFGLDGQKLILAIGALIVVYILILFVRIGIWIALGILSLAAIFFLFQSIPIGFCYLGFSSYAAILLYNLYIAVFWKAKEWDEIDENMPTEKIEQV